MKYEELVKELNELPKGYISKKKINGNTYNYLQYLEDGKLHSQYVREENIEEIYSGLLRREKIEKQIDKDINQGRKLPTISKHAKELTGYLMMGDEIVGIYEKGIPTYINYDKCPLLIKRTNNLRKFLSSRVIDSSRTNSRILKKVMSIKENDDCLVSLYCYGSVITDNYWFKPKKSKLRYKDISFKNDSYAETSLTGNIYFFPKSPKYTPQLTLGGSYEKCWKYEDKKWYLYKKGNKEEIFSEILASYIASLLNIETAIYSLDGDFIKTQNFADKENFEPMSSVAGDNDNYENVYMCLKEYGEDIIKQYLKLIWFDALINNVDRHNENCGLLKDKKTGRVNRLAPNFDNNMSLISRNKVLNLDPSNDGFIKLFIEFVKKNKEVSNYYKQLDIRELKENDLYFAMSNIGIEEDENMIVRYLMNRYKYLKKLL